METRPKNSPLSSLTTSLAANFYDQLFPKHLQLAPGISDIYELELAFYESNVLSDAEMIRRGAYFAQVGSSPTYHALICGGEALQLPQFASSRLRSFFESKQFKTGYATHGLFPYRGKFHPQMIKSLINIMGLKPGDTILDPMMGSGTVLIEACLMEINSIGIDASPFCQFMTQAKLNGLTIPLERVHAAYNNHHNVFEYFQKIKVGTKPRSMDRDSKAVQDFLLLAYLDSVGYSERSSRNSAVDQFQAVLKRYHSATEKVQKTLSQLDLKMAQATPLEGDARFLPLPKASIDGIIFSPPYSFAIDYLQNDLPHLNFMGAEIASLNERMIGLRGKNLRQKFDLYQTDMEKVLSECARVLRPSRYCTIIVGTNDNQIGKALGLPPSSVPGLDEILIEIGGRYGFHVALKLGRQITGISNTMRTESIIMLERER